VDRAFPPIWQGVDDQRSAARRRLRRYLAYSLPRAGWISWATSSTLPICRPCAPPPPSRRIVRRAAGSTAWGLA
jgi:hypothetical protein